MLLLGRKRGRKCLPFSPWLYASASSLFITHQGFHLWRSHKSTARPCTCVCFTVTSNNLNRTKVSFYRIHLNFYILAIARVNHQKCMELHHTFNLSAYFYCCNDSTLLMFTVKGSFLAALTAQDFL